MPTITSRPPLGWDEITSGHKAVVDDNTVNVTKSLDYDELKKLVGTYPIVSSAATLSLSHPGRFIHTGTGTTWTLLAGSTALDGLPFTWANNGSGSIVLKNNGGTTITTILAGARKEGFWSQDQSTWIIY